MLILIGPQGSGKGTQAELLVKKYSAVHLSTGEMFRNSKDPSIHELLEKGQLIDDQTTARVLEGELSGIATGTHIILDGYPRTLMQVQLLESLLEKHGQKVEAVILLDLPRQETVSRLLARGRKDDTEEAINHRLQQFEDETKPVIEFYRKHNLVKEVDGTGSVDAVFKRIEGVIPWR